MSTNPAQRLADAVLARRRELDMTQLEVWNAGGPSNSTLTKIENGDLTTLTRKTARSLDTGLRWEPGSARDLYEKGLPPLPVSAGTRPDRAGAARLRAIIAAANDVDDDTRRALLEALDERGAS